jgi:tetratricopeptide (TPR) repeat protein
MKITHRLVLGAALSVLLAFVSTGCNREAKAERKLTAAKEAFAKNDYATAEIEFKNVLDLEPGHPGALRGLGLIWVKQGASLEGARMLLGAKSKLQDDDDVAVSLAKAMLDLGFVGDSRKELLELLDRNPGHGEGLMLLAESSLTPEMMSECMERIARSNASDKAPVLLASALVQLRRGDVEAGTKTVDRVLEIDSNFSRALVLKGKLLSMSKQPEKALELIKRGAEIAGPQSAENVAYASFLMGLKRQDEAVAHLKAATQKAPDFLPNWRLLGQIAAGSGNDAEATEYLSNVFDKSPIDIEAGLLQSQIWLRTKQAPKAVELLENLTKALPSRANLDIALAKAYLAADEYRKAGEVLDRVLIAFPGATEAIVLRSGLFLKDGQPAEAIRLVEPLYNAQPSNRGLQDLLVNAYRAAKRPDDAVAILKKQAVASPDDPEPQFQIGQSLLSQGKSQEAREAFTRVLTLAPDHLGALSQLVVLDQREGKNNEAMARVDAFISAHPESAHAHLLKAGLFYARKEFKEAETSAIKAIELKPDESAAYVMLVRIQTTDGRVTEAVDRLNQLLANSPDNREARIHLASLLQQLGRVDESRASLLEMIKADPDFAPAYNNLAYLESQVASNLDQALEYARKARSLAPNDPSIADTLGWIEWQRGNFRQALPLILEAASRLPEYATVQYHLGMAHYMMYQFPEAMAGLDKALAIEGPFPEKADATAALTVLREGGKWDLATLETRSKEKPKDVVVLILKARQLAAAGRNEDALAAYQAALAVNPDLDAAYLGQADLYATTLNQPEKALEAANQARKVAPQSARAAAFLGSLNFRSGNFQQAYDLLQEAVRKLPEDAGIQFDAAWAAYSMGRVDDARSAMGKVPADDASRAAEAAEFLALTAPDVAANPATPALIEKALAKSPDHVPALMARGRMQEKAGENPAETYRKVLGVYPQFDPARIGLARILLDDPSQIEAAEKLATEARERLANDPELGGILAIINFRRDRFDLAVQLLRELSVTRPLSGRELFALGMSQAATKRPDEAKKSLTEALKTELSDADAAKAKSALEELGRAGERDKK